MMAIEQTKRQNLFSKGLDAVFEEVAEIAGFTLNVFREGLRPPFEFREVLKQCYEVGIKSFLVVGITACFLGVVLILK